MRTLINRIDYLTINNLEIQSAIVSLDGEKLFDKVIWKLIFAALHIVGF